MATLPGRRICVGGHHSGVSEVPVQSLLAQHCDKRGQQRHQKTRVQKVQGCDDLCRGTTPDWRGSCRVFVWGNGSVEAEEDRSEVG